MSSPVLYTLGYAGWTAQEVADVVRALGACLVDIRLAPVSRKVGFSGGALRALGLPYVHLPELGNRNFRTGGPVVLADPERGFVRLRALLAEGPVVLLCGCRDVERCHRRIVAETLSEVTGAPVKHLSPPDVNPSSQISLF